MGALVGAWKQLPARYSVSDWRSAVLRARAAADGAPHGAQLAQLHRQGVGRFFGLITTASNLGIIRPRRGGHVPRRRNIKGAFVRLEPSTEQTYRLGTNLTEYKAWLAAKKAMVQKLSAEYSALFAHWPPSLKERTPPWFL